jgi:hypothetical protein
MELSAGKLEEKFMRIKNVAPETSVSDSAPETKEVEAPYVQPEAEGKADAMPEAEGEIISSGPSTETAKKKGGRKSEAEQVKIDMEFLDRLKTNHYTEARIKMGLTLKQAEAILMRHRKSFPRPDLNYEISNAKDLLVQLFELTQWPKSDDTYFKLEKTGDGLLITLFTPKP